MIPLRTSRAMIAPPSTVVPNPLPLAKGELEGVLKGWPSPDWRTPLDAPLARGRFADVLSAQLAPSPTRSRRYVPDVARSTHSGLSRYHCTVRRSPDSKSCSGRQPRSLPIFVVSIA